MELRQRRVVIFHTSAILRQKINGEEVDTTTGDDLGSEDKTKTQAE